MKYLDKFISLAEIYDNYRPHYDPKLFDYLTLKSVNPVTKPVVDIGAGTGILTEDLREHPTCTVTAIEPNYDMRRILVSKFSEDSNVTVLDTTAENTGLADNSVDFIIVGHAFHWFDVPAFKRECQSVLHDNGEVCLVWNSRLEDNPLAQDSMELFRKYCPNFSGFRGGVEAGEKYADEFFMQYSVKKIDAPTYFDLPMFIGRNLSMSYAPKCGEENYKPFIDGLVDLFIKHSNPNGTITVENEVVCYLGFVK